MKENILFFIDDLLPCGAQRQMVNLAIELVKLDYKITFLVYRKGDFYDAMLHQNGIEIKRVNLNYGYMKRFFTCRSFIRKGNFDVVLAFLEGPCMFASLASFPYRKWRLVLGERSANPTMLTSLKQKVYRFLHFTADAVVANSHKNIEMLLSINPLIKKQKTSVIYNLYDVKQFEQKEKYDYLSQDKFVLTIASNFRYWKNFDGLIEAVNLLDDRYKDRLQINWYGFSFEEVDDSKKKGEQKIKEYKLNDVFNLFPPTKSILEKMHNSDAVGLFSHFEGLSNTICEAMALGKPIITTRVSDNHLLLKDNETAFLCDSNSSVDISRALKKLLDCSKEELAIMGKKNKVFFESKFDKNVIIDKYLNILKG